jgi:drug/metabolite transporter (DMT)-like permease
MNLNWTSSPAIARVALVGICAVWGSTFLIVQNAINKMPVPDFLAFRFTIAAVVMILLRPQCLRGMTRKGFLRGIGLGTVLGLGYIAQTYGLMFASATVSGFITGMYVVLTPIMSWLILRQKINRITLFAVALATMGLAFLSLRGWVVGTGEMLTLACAVFYALHIVGLGVWSVEYEPYGFSLIQIATVAVITLIAASPGGITIPPDAATWATVAVTAVLATALAFLVQTWAQSLVSATSAAVTMTMEPVFAGLFGVLLGGNLLTPQIIIGAVSILAAMLIVSTRSSSKVSRLES